MTEHTPGPWRWEGERVLVEPGLMLYERLSSPTENGGTPAPVLCVNTYGDELCVDEADARLIAAAPELLETLRTLRGFVVERHPDGTPYSWLGGTKSAEQIDDMAAAAIAKATGEQP